MILSDVKVVLPNHVFEHGSIEIQGDKISKALKPKIGTLAIVSTPITTEDLQIPDARFRKNEFHFLYSDELNEAKALGLNIKNEHTFPLHTRLMYYDLININSGI